MSTQTKYNWIFGSVLVALCSWAAWHIANSGQVAVPPAIVEQPVIEQNPGSTVQAAPQQAVLEGVGGKQENGTWLMGYTPHKEASLAYIKSLEKPFFAQAGPDAMAKARDDQPVLLYRALYEANAHFNGGEKWIVGKQGIGDCVSWGWAHAADIHLAVLWKLKVSGEWKQAATEAIYGGSRVEARGVSSGGWSDGSYGSAAAKWVKNYGVVFRQPYDTVDLSIYDAGRAKQWGNYGCGGKGDEGHLDKVAKEHPIKQVALVRNFDEAAAAIQSGYPVPVCSSQGFASTRDKDGFSRGTGRWAHCMCFVGVRYGERPGLLCLNSWGPNWIGGPVWPDDQPAGSFWVDKRVVDSMLSGEDSFAVSGYEGFPHQDLHHGDWVFVNPPSSRAYVQNERREIHAETTSYTLSP